jgi:hypothetical protein
MRILTIDIETSPINSYVWSLFGSNFIPLDRIIAPTRMICYAAKFLGEKEVYFGDFRDPNFLKDLYVLLDNADAVCTYNGEAFDMKHINREFAEAGFGPPRPLASIDLFKTVKQNFKFPSNKLDYVAGVLLGVHKTETGGFGLWPAYMKGEVKARKTMERYNRQDIRITERLYKFLRPWVKNHPHVGEVPEWTCFGKETFECPVCAHKKVNDMGVRRTRCFAIRQCRCAKCGHWYEGKRKKI